MTVTATRPRRTPAAVPVLPRLNYEIGRQLERLHHEPPPNPGDPETWAWAAVVLLANPSIHDGLRAAETLAELDRQHQPAGPMALCGRCHVRPPCSVQQVIRPGHDTGDGAR